MSKKAKSAGKTKRDLGEILGAMEDDIYRAPRLAEVIRCIAWHGWENHFGGLDNDQCAALNLIADDLVEALSAIETAWQAAVRAQQVPAVRA
jgi:hypothetical protein